jgi:putative endonuclease
VYYETTGNVQSAIAREKQLKGWVRRKKVELIETVNPGWVDLAGSWFERAHPSPDHSLRSG